MIANNTFIRANWKNFLRVDANKDGLFKFLATIPKISISTREAKYIDPMTKRGIISNAVQVVQLTLMWQFSELLCQAQ